MSEHTNETPRAAQRPAGAGGYVDAQGRSEVVVHPDIVRGSAGFRRESEVATEVTTAPS